MRQVIARPSWVKKEHKRRFVGGIFWKLLILIIFFLGLGFVSHIPKLNINEISADGLKVIDKDAVAEGVLRHLSGRKALVFAKSNIFLFSKEGVTEFIKNNFPRVYEVRSVEREGRKLLIDIEERQAAYLWCGHEAPSYVSNWEDRECFFVDQKGFIFDSAPFFTDGVYFTVYGGIPKDTDPVGQTIMLRGSMESLVSLVEALDSNGLPAHSLVLLDETEYHLLLDIYNEFGDFSRIIMNEDETLEEIKNKLLNALAEPGFIEEFEEKKGRLQYIDTRFKNRVFYKFSNE